MKNCTLLALIAGALAGGAFATDPDEVNLPSIAMDAPGQSSYSSRANQKVYGYTFASGLFRARGTAYQGGNRFTFNSGPGNNLDSVTLNGFALAISQDDPGIPTTEQIAILDFYLDPVVGSPISATSLPALSDGQAVLNFGDFTTPGFITFFVDPVQFVDANNAIFTLPLDRPGATDGIRGFVNLAIGYTDPTDPTAIIVSPDCGPFFWAGPLSVGQNPDGLRWSDADRNGLYTLAPTNESFGNLAVPANARGLYLQLQSDLLPPAPPGNINLGCLPDAGLSTTFALPANGVQWFQVCLNGDATDAANQFLNFDSEGSAIGASAALYNLDGNLVGVVQGNDDGGSGTNFLLTYGVGLQGASGDGDQRDGINGQLFAGGYYVAVSGDGGSFGPSFNAVGAGGGGSVTVNFQTNTNGGALPPFVEPAIRAGNDLGALADGGAPGNAFTLPRYEVDWYKFSICTDVASPLFLDIDFSAQGTTIADVDSRLFDSNGNALFYSGNVDGNRPQFSFGDVGPRSQGSSTVPFDGSTAAVLTAGTYFLASTLVTQTVATSGRFHARSNSGSSLTYHVDFYTNIDSTLCPSVCPPCAADYDNSGGVDGADVEAFFVDWSASAACADVDQSGGVGGEDVEFFFIVWGNGGC